MAVRDRIRKYRKVGGAADLVRVEVLVPAAEKQAILSAAKEIRDNHRKRKERLSEFLRLASERYGLRIFDNIDLSKIDNLDSRSRLVANALIERGDSRAYAMGRRILTEIETAI